LAFNRVGDAGGYFTGFMLPPLQTPEGVREATKSIRCIADAISVPFLFETAVNYLRPMKGMIPDGAFTSQICTESQCGILLDLHNIWANQLNGRQSVEEFLSEIPLDQVVELHIAGGLEIDGLWLDAHSGSVPWELLELTKCILPRLPNAKAMIFEIMPNFIPSFGLEAVRRQIDVLQEIWELRSSSRNQPGTRIPQPQLVSRDALDVTGVTPRQWESALGSTVLGRVPENDLARELVLDPGVKALQNLVWNFRAGAIADTLKLTVRLLFLSWGTDRTRDLLTEYFESHPPELFGSAEGHAFADWLQRRSLELPYLDEVLAFEAATLRSLLNGTTEVVRFTRAPLPFLQEIADGNLPSIEEPGTFELEITPDVDMVVGTVTPRAAPTDRSWSLSGTTDADNQA
jgi:hypothetical protein